MPVFLDSLQVIGSKGRKVAYPSLILKNQKQILMNKQRRKELSDIFDQLEKIKDQFGEELSELKEQITSVCGNARIGLEEIRTRLESARDEEQEAYDNLPESLQDGEKGQAMSEAIGEMDEAISNIQETEEKLESFTDDFIDVDNDLDTALTSIDNAKGES